VALGGPTSMTPLDAAAFWCETDFKGTPPELLDAGYPFSSSTGLGGARLSSFAFRAISHFFRST